MNWNKLKGCAASLVTVAASSVVLVLPILVSAEIRASGPRRAKRLQTFIATAYSLPGKTASGVPVRRGIVAADPKVLPMGSIIRIHDSAYAGTYTVLDTGSNVRGRIIDIYVPTRKEAIRFGTRRVRVEVLRRGRQALVARE